MAIEPQDNHPDSQTSAHRADIAFRLTQQLRTEIEQHRVTRTTIAVLLWKVEQEEYYKDLGFQTFPEYCASPAGLHLEWSQRTIQDYIHTIETYVNLSVDVERLQGVHFSNLTLLAPVATNSNIDDVLADAQEYGNRDLRQRKKEGVYSGADNPLDAEKEPEPKIVLIQCPHCGQEFQR